MSPPISVVELVAAKYATEIPCTVKEWRRLMVATYAEPVVAVAKDARWVMDEIDRLTMAIYDERRLW